MGERPCGATCSPSNGLRLYGSPLHLKQILINLLTNACKHTEKGRVTLTASVAAAAVAATPDAHGADADKGAPLRVPVAFMVRDTGRGVPLDKQSLIFKPFEQAQAKRTRRSRAPATPLRAGTGLGLP